MSEARANGDFATVNLACFDVRGGIYGLEVHHVREIVRMMDITALPGAPPLVEGVVDLRGAVVPILDLGRLLGRGHGVVSSSSRIAVLEYDDLVVGLWVDAATDVLTLDVAKLGDVPTLASHSGESVVRHVVRREGAAPVMVLALDALIDKVYRSALPEAAVGSVAGGVG